MLIEGITGLAGKKRPIIVIGSGPVGLALATDLARRKIPVTVLESGGGSENPTIQGLSDAVLTDKQRHDEMEVAVARRLGGTSNLWGARCLPFDPIDFQSRDFVNVRWPISYEELAEYWTAALSATAAGEETFATEEFLPGGSDPAFSMHSLERWANIQAAQNVHAEAIKSDPMLEVRTLTTVTALNVGVNGQLESIKVAHSLTGETIVVPVEQLVIAAGGLETTRLLLATQREHPDLFGGKTGPLGRYYMGHVIGEIADITFSSKALGRAFNFNIDGGSYVRRRIVPSEDLQIEQRLLNCAFWPVVAPVADSNHKSAILSMVYLALAYGPIGRLLVAEAIRRRHIPERPNQIPQHVRNIFVGAPHAAAFAAKFFWRRYFRPERLPGFFVENSANRYGLFYHAEQAPTPESRAWLTSQTDRLGLPMLEINLAFSDQDIDSVVRTHDHLDDWLRRTGVGSLDYRMNKAERHASVLAQAAHGTHQCGLARMGLNQNEAVVDGNLRSFDLPNLFLATTAVLPTSGQANPTMTTVALALRLAAYLANKVKDSNSVPHTASPVVSQ